MRVASYIFGLLRLVILSSLKALLKTSIKDAGGKYSLHILRITNLVSTMANEARRLSVRVVDMRRGWVGVV